MDKKNKKKDGYSIASMIFVGCMFIGGGIGKLMGKVAAGWQIGMGAGFIAIGIIWAYYQNKE